MSNLKKIISALIVLVMMMSLCALADETVADPTLADDETVITINGKVVTGADVNERYNYYVSYYSDSYDVTDASIKAAIRNIACKSAIQDTVMLAKIDEMNIELTEDEKNEVIDSYTAQWNELLMSNAESFGYSSELTDEENQKALDDTNTYMEAVYGVTLQELIDANLQNQRLNKLYDQMTADVTVDPAEVEAAYQAEAAQHETMLTGNAVYYELYTLYGYQLYYIPEGYRGIKQVLLAVDDTLLQDYKTKSEALANGEEGTTAEDVEAARAAVLASVQESLDDIYTSFNNGTATFDELIAKYNIDPGMTSEPYMTEGYSVHQDSIMWDAAFISAAMSIDAIGGISEPSVGEYGIYICYYLRDVPAGIQPMTEAIRAEIESELLSDKANETFAGIIDQWLAESDVVYSDAYHAYIGE